MNDASKHKTARTDQEESILERLSREGFRYDFFQAVTLLGRHFAGQPLPGETFDPSAEPVHFRPHDGATFPATDVRRVERTDGRDGERADVICNFMGLYGIGSPLPTCYYDNVDADAEGRHRLHDFYDIFNHRLYSYFFRARKKYRPFATALRASDPPVRRFSAIAGLASAGSISGGGLRVADVARFAGRLSGVRRNAEGLRAILESALDGAPVEVIENIPRWVRLQEVATLGRQGTTQAKLDGASTLGESLVDVCGKFRLSIGPVGVETFIRLLPGGQLARRVADVVRGYVSDVLTFDVEIILLTEGVRPTVLGDESLRLGMTTFVGRPRPGVVARIVDYVRSPVHRAGSQPALA